MKPECDSIGHYENTHMWPVIASNRCSDKGFLAMSVAEHLELLVIPLILSELEKEPDHWFWALEAITGENPVTKKEAGDMEASDQSWIRWGKQNGQLPK